MPDSVFDRLARYWPWLVLGYYALHVAARVAISPALELDEAEQTLYSQRWALGYDEQPPLYTWLQAAVFAVLGVNVLALSLLKHALLAAAHLGLYAAGRAVANPVVGMIASASLFLIPHFGWETPRDLTNSVLAIAATAGAVWMLVRAVESGRAADYLALGLVLGVGLLAKYNMAAVALAALAAGLRWHPNGIRAGSRAAGLAGGVALLMLAVPAGWHLAHWTTLMTDSRKLHQGEVGGPLVDALAGVAAFAQSAAALCLLLAVVWLIARRWQQPVLRVPDRRRAAIGWLFWGAVGISIVAVLASAATAVRERWLLPIAVVAAAWAALTFGLGLGRRGRAVLAGTGGVLGLLFLVATPLQVVLAPVLRDKPTRLNEPYDLVAERLLWDGPAPALVLTDDDHVGGVLRVVLPGALVSIPEQAVRWPVPPGAPVLLFWTGDQPMPVALVELAASFGLAAADEPVHALALPMRFAPDFVFEARYVRMTMP